jgi:hypothetical protein
MAQDAKRPSLTTFGLPLMITPREISDEASFQAAVTRRCGLVLVSPPWSIYSMRARGVFAEAAQELAARRICTPDDFFILIDDNAANENPFWVWLGIPTQPKLPESVAMGAGSVVWLCNGGIAHYEFSANHIGADGLVDTTVRVLETYNENETEEK